MLTTLLESRARSPRRRMAIAASVLGHSILLTTFALTRADGAPHEIDKPLQSSVVYFPPKPPSPQPERARPATRVATPPQLPGIVLLPPPIPSTAADIVAFVRPVPNYVGSGTFVHNTIPSVAHDSNAVLSAFTVDVPVEIIAGQRPPRYPLVLERAGVAGDVVAQFVVDTAGRVERGSVTILQASHTEFAHSVRERLVQLRFIPARAQGRVVRQLVEQRFAFEIRR
jgi:protein TonB